MWCGCTGVLRRTRRLLAWMLPLRPKLGVRHDDWKLERFQFFRIRRVQIAPHPEDDAIENRPLLLRAALGVVEVVGQFLDSLEQFRTSNKKDDIYAVDKARLRLERGLAGGFAICQEEFFVAIQPELHLSEACRASTLKSVGYEVANESPQSAERGYRDRGLKVHGASKNLTVSSSVC